MMSLRLMTTEHRLIVALCKSHLDKVLEFERPLIERLFEIGVPSDAGLAEMFEEVANMYMDLSEAITAAVRASHHAEHASSRQTVSLEMIVG
jgi:hypothetical protein